MSLLFNVHRFDSPHIIIGLIKFNIIRLHDLHPILFLRVYIDYNHVLIEFLYICDRLGIFRIVFFFFCNISSCKE